MSYTYCTEPRSGAGCDIQETSNHEEHHDELTFFVRTPVLPRLCAHFVSVHVPRAGRDGDDPACLRPERTGAGSTRSCGLRALRGQTENRRHTASRTDAFTPFGDARFHAPEAIVAHPDRKCFFVLDRPARKDEAVRIWKIASDGKGPGGLPGRIHGRGWSVRSTPRPGRGARRPPARGRCSHRALAARIRRRLAATPGRADASFPEDHGPRPAMARAAFWWRAATSTRSRAAVQAGP